MTIPRYDPSPSPVDPGSALTRARNLLERKQRDPDSVPYTLEQCEARVTRAEQGTMALPSCPIRPAILELLSAPTTVLADCSRWPALDDIALATPLAENLYRQWLEDRARAQGGAWETAWQSLPGQLPPAMEEGRVDSPVTLAGTSGMEEAPNAWIQGFVTGVDRGTFTARLQGGHLEEIPQETGESRALAWLTAHTPWPYPVGQRCTIFGTEKVGDLPASAARSLMPFDDDTYAALMVPLTGGDRRVTLFFMARQVRYEVLLEGDWLPTPEPGDDAEPGLPVWVIDGNEVRVVPPIPRVHLETIRNARTWWKTLAGLPIGPGRPKGSRKRTARDVIDQLRAFKALHGPIPPSRDEFLLDCLGIEPTQWQRLKDDWEIDWQDLREAVYGSTTRKRAHIDHGL